MCRQSAGSIPSPRDTKMMYVQDSNCSMENSDFCDLSRDEIAYIQTNARRLFAL